MVKLTTTLIATSLLYVACCGMPHLPWTISQVGEFQTELGDAPEVSERFAVELTEAAVSQAQAHGGYLGVRIHVAHNARTAEAFTVTLASTEPGVEAMGGACSANQPCDLWLSANMDLPERCVVDGDCRMDFDVTFASEGLSAVQLDWSVHSDVTVFDPDEDHEHAGAPEDAGVIVTLAN